MSDQPSVPTHLLSTEWGTVIVRCSHPERVAFVTGFNGTAPLVVNGVEYLCDIVISRAELPAGQQNDRVQIGGGWHVRRAAAWWGLRRPGHHEATDAARRTFDERILPGFHQWLTTDDARALLADGHQHWRREFAEKATATKDDLVAAFQRLQDIAARVANGDILNADDEEFASKARVQVP